MKTIELNVSYDKLFKDDEDVRTVEGSRNYTQIHFNFLTDDWKNVKMKVAYFEYDNGKTDAELVDTDNMVTIPSRVLALQYFKVSLKGYTETIDQLIPTNKVDIVVDSTIEPNTDIPTENKYILRSFYEVTEDNYVMKFLRNDGTTFELSLSNIKNDISSKADPTKFDLTYDVDNGVVNLTYNNEVIGTVDFGEKLVLESATYDKNTKSIILKFTSGDIITIPVSDLSDIYKGGTTETTTVTMTDENEIKVEINEAYKVKKSDVDNKVDKVTGKQLSTNDFTNELKTKLDGISEGATKVIVDSELSSTSENPVQNKVITSVVNNKLDKVTTSTTLTQVYAKKTNGKQEMRNISTSPATDVIPVYDSNKNIKTSTPVADNDTTPKVYVDEKVNNVNTNVEDLTQELNELKEQLNGYLFDETEVTLNEVDTAVIPKTVQVGSSTYNVADNSRAGVVEVQGKSNVAHVCNMIEVDGKSVKFNQLFNKSTLKSTVTQDGITYTIDKTKGTITANGTNTIDNGITYFTISSGYINIINGHKYLLRGTPSNQTNGTMSCFGSGIINALDSGLGTIATANSSGQANFTIAIKSGATVSNAVFTPQLYDLTAMGLDDISLTDFNKKFQSAPYEYNSGELKHVAISEVTARALNMIDKSKIQYTTTSEQGVTLTSNKDKGTVTINGTNSSSTQSIYFHLFTTTNQMRIVNGHKYLLKGAPSNSTNSTAYLQLYGNKYGVNIISLNNSNQMSIGTATLTGIATIVIIVREGATVSNMTFQPQLFDLTEYYGAGNEPTSVADVPFANDEKYHEYFSETLTLSSPLTLRGIDDVYCDKLYLQGDNLSSGVVLRRFAEVDLGTLSWSKSTSDNIFSSLGIADTALAGTTNYIILNYTSWNSTIETMPDKSIIIVTGQAAVYIRDDSYTDAVTFKTAMSGVKLVYELATKTSEAVTTGGLTNSKEEIFHLLDTNTNSTYDMIDREKIRYGKIKDNTVSSLVFKGKNLFDKNNHDNIHKNTTISINGELASAPNTVNALTLELPYSSTTMTISFKKKVDTDNQTYGFNCYSSILDENKNVVEAKKDISVSNAKVTSFTITNINPSQINKGYIRIALVSDYLSAGYELENIQFEVGSTASSYSEYRTPKVVALPSAQELRSAKNAYDTIEVVKNASGLFDMNKIQRIGTYTFNGTEVIVWNGFAYPTVSWNTHVVDTLSKASSNNYVLDMNGLSIKQIYTSAANTLIIEFGEGSTDYDKFWASSTVDEPSKVLKGAILNYELATPTTTSIATNLTLDEVTAIIEANGLVTVNGNSVNEAFAKPNVKLELVYRKIS